MEDSSPETYGNYRMPWEMMPQALELARRGAVTKWDNEDVLDVFLDTGTNMLLRNGRFLMQRTMLATGTKAWMAAQAVAVHDTIQFVVTDGVAPVTNLLRQWCASPRATIGDDHFADFGPETYARHKLAVIRTGRTNLDAEVALDVATWMFGSEVGFYPYLSTTEDIAKEWNAIRNKHMPHRLRAVPSIIAFLHQVMPKTLRIFTNWMMHAYPESHVEFRARLAEYHALTDPHMRMRVAFRVYVPHGEGNLVTDGIGTVEMEGEDVEAE